MAFYCIQYFLYIFNLQSLHLPIIYIHSCLIKLIIDRVLLGIASILLVSALITTIIFYAPVDPARLSFGQRSDEETIQLFKRKYYLDQPCFVQVFRFFEDLSPVQYIYSKDIRLNDYHFTKIIEISGNFLIFKKPYFRKSYVNGQNVWPQIVEAIPGTLVLALASIIISIIIGMIMGFISALKFESWWDKSILIFCSISYAIPSYVSAVILGIIFAYVLGDWTGLQLQGSLWITMTWANKDFI